MRILLVIDSFFTGGAEFSTLELFSYLKSNGVDIRICKTKDKHPQYNPEQFGLNSDIISTLPEAGFFEKRKALKKLIHNFKPDIVHSVLFNANFLVRTVKFFNTSFVHLESLVNHTYSENRLNEPGVTKLKLEVYRLLDGVTGFFGTNHFHPNGYSVAEHYQKKLFISSKKMTVVHRGRKSNDIQPTISKETFGIQDDKLVLINVARQEYQKGQDVLIEAISLLPKSILEKIHLLIVGREGKSTSSLLKMIEDKNVESNITFLGHRTDISSLLKISDIFVFPSRFEGLPGVLIEAESSGLPIICTHLSMMLEVVEENVNALTFEMDNSVQFAEMITKLVSDESLRKKFSENSKLIFNKKFQIEFVHLKMLDLYKNLLR